MLSLCTILAIDEVVVAMRAVNHPLREQVLRRSPRCGTSRFGFRTKSSGSSDRVELAPTIVCSSVEFEYSLLHTTVSLSGGIAKLPAFFEGLVSVF